jgi:hypothetical protein
VHYYVISADNNRYGPADLTTLNQWAAEGRVLPHQMVEDAATGIRIPASSVPGLFFNPTTTHAQPGYFAQPYYGDNGARDISRAWLYGCIGLLCGCVGIPFAVMGVVAATRAGAKGHPGARAARTFNIIALLLGVGGLLLGLPALGALSRFGGFP